MSILDLQSNKHLYKIGLISDTHGKLNSSVVDIFCGVDVIIHAGDIGKPTILQKLDEIAPVVAVRGNMDSGSWASDLPDFELFEISNRWIYVLHDLHHFDLDPTVLGIDAVVSGHIHKTSIENENGVLFINPGSATLPRYHQAATVGLLQLFPRFMQVQFVELT